MKPNFFNQQPPLCARDLKQSYSFWQSLSVSLQRSLSGVHRSVNQGILGGLAVSLQELVSNQRYTVGIIFLLVLAPLASVIYQVCDPSVEVEGWFFVNNYYFLFTLSNYFMLSFASVGIFLLFPVKCKISYLAMVWPFGYAISKILYYGFFVNSNEQFHQSGSWVLLIAGLLVAIGLLLSANYLAYRKYHLKDGTIARIKGIIAAPGISAADKMRLLEDQSLELENFNQRY
jgi:hypothetical protein